MTDFVDPETHAELVLADADTLARIRTQVAELEGAYVTRDGRRAYPIRGGVPHFLVESRIDLDPPVEVAS